MERGQEQRRGDGEAAARRYSVEKICKQKKNRKRRWEVGKEGRRAKEEMEDKEKVKGNKKE